jgi:deazaflavin-dependent oxidoreductase (nitroreductase family)
MPLPQRLARFNKRVTNRVARHVAGWMPGLAIVTHRGRVSAKEYRTPVNIFRSGIRGERCVFALTYGSNADWVKNVRAAGRGTVRTRRSDIALTDPELVVDPTRRVVPAPARWILGLVHVDEFLAMTVDGGGSDHRYAVDHGSAPSTQGPRQQAAGVETTEPGEQRERRPPDPGEG